MKVKSFISSFFTFSLGILISRGISFFLIPIYINEIDVEAFGLLDLITQTNKLLILIGSLEVIQGVTRFYYDKKDNQKEIVSSAFLFGVFSHVLISLILVYNAEDLAYFFLGDKKYFESIFILAALSFFAFINSFSSSMLIVKREGKKFSVSSIIYALFSAFFSIYFVRIANLGLNGVLLGLLGGYLISSILNLYFVKDIITLKFSSKELIKMFSFSLPLLAASISEYFNMYADRLIISKLLPLNDLGVYALAFKLALIGMIFYGIFKTTLIPYIFENYQKKYFKDDMVKIQSQYFYFTLFIVFFSSIFSEDVISLISDERYILAANFVPLFILSFSFSYGIIFFPGFSIAKKTKWITIISICSCSLNIALNFCLIPIIGIYGAILGSIISNGMMLLSYIVFSKKFYSINYNSKTFKDFFITLGFLIVFFLFLKEIKDPILIMVYKLFFLFSYTIYIYSRQKKEILYLFNRLSKK